MRSKWRRRRRKSSYQGTVGRRFFSRTFSRDKPLPVDNPITVFVLAK
jgi:hypothetical protein